MTTAFRPETFALCRRPSTSLLGLLPLVLVPYGVWWVAHISGARGLPPWAVPARAFEEFPAAVPRSLGLVSNNNLDADLDSVPASQLHVEITEHHELSPDSPAQYTLRALRAAGVGIYLDDYGTGYTSLEYLRRFPIQVLKLDRSVVTSLDGGEVPLVAAVNAMAAALDLEVLAEGVETPEQRDRLVELGVRYGQGYLFARPLPPDEYATTALTLTPEVRSASRS